MSFESQIESKRENHQQIFNQNFMKNLPITLFFLVSALLNTGCKSENTALTTPFSIQMKSLNEFTEGLPENTVESFESYESDCIEYLLYNMIDKKLDIMSFNVKVWKGVIDLNDGNVLNSVLGMGSLNMMQHYRLLKMALTQVYLNKEKTI